MRLKGGLFMKYKLFFINGNDVSCTTENKNLSTILDGAYQDSFIQKLYVRRTIISCGHRFEQDILVYDIYNSTIELRFPE